MTSGKTKPAEMAVRWLEDSNVTAAPVPVERMAKAKGAQLRFSPLDEAISGMVYIKEGTPIIGVNSLHHPNRQRFTIAHECGHLALHKAEITKEVHVDLGNPMLMRDTKSATGTDKMEIEANAFAAELLMPATLLREQIAQGPIDIDDEGAVGALAKMFRVSTSAMRLRLGNLMMM